MGLEYRKDYRTLKQFAQDIKLRTKKEKFLVGLFQRECELRGLECTVIDNGIDNSGKIVENCSCQPDYKITINGKTYLYDIKNSPVGTKWTFKIHNLQQYVKYKSGIIIFWNTGCIDKDPTKINYENTRYGIIGHRNIEKMLNTYDPYNEYMFGNKLCIKILAEDFSKWVNIKSLTL